MDALIIRLNKTSDDQEQYQRRLCLRNNGIPAPPEGKQETGDDCLEHVKRIFDKDLGLKIPDELIDRAHRIGKTKSIDGKKFRQISVSFTTWRHRTTVYQARKKAKNLRFKLDLTRNRFNIIEKANVMLKLKGQCFYAFADINCRLCARIDEEFHYFSDMNDLVSELEE